MGDFNQDLLQYNHQVPTEEFIDSLSSHAFLPLIFNPTRLTSYSATLIDHIFTNKLAHKGKNGPHFATWKIPMKPTMILLKNIPLVSL